MSYNISEVLKQSSVEKFPYDVNRILSVGSIVIGETQTIITAMEEFSELIETLSTKEINKIHITEEYVDSIMSIKNIYNVLKYEYNKFIGVNHHSSVECDTNTIIMNLSIMIQKCSKYLRNKNDIKHKENLIQYTDFLYNILPNVKTIYDLDTVAIIKMYNYKVDRFERRCRTKKFHTL